MSGTEILNELNDVYKEECPSRSFVLAEFKRERENVIDENCGGRPSEIGDSKQLAIEALIRKKKDEFQLEILLLLRKLDMGHVKNF